MVFVDNEDVIFRLSDISQFSDNTYPSISPQQSSLTGFKSQTTRPQSTNRSEHNDVFKHILSHLP